MPDLRFQHTEELVGAGHPTKSDTINRLVLAEHNPDGTHGDVTITGGLSLASGVWPGARVHLGSNQTILNATWSLVYFSSAAYVDGITHDTQNMRLVVPVSGVYLLRASIYTGSSYNGATLWQQVLSIRKNGSSVGMGYGPRVAGQVGMTTELVVIDKAAANDYYDVHMWQDIGGNYTLNADTDKTFFQIQRIG